MRIIGTTTELNTEFKRLMLNYKEYLWTIAWADFDFEFSKLLLERQARIKKLCIGLQFYGTHPSFLEAFHTHTGVRFNNQNKGTYHPKLYLFRNNESEWEILIGSGNFTNSAFQNNTEVSVLISSSDLSIGNLYVNTIKFIDEQWKRGEILTEDYIIEYKTNTLKIKKFIPKLPSNSITQPLFRKTWKEYLENLMQKDYKDRIKFLNWVKEQFKQQGQFDKMDLKTRKSIAGFGSGDIENNDVIIGCFGNTDARGYFKNAIINKPKIITDALSKIPKFGQVLKIDYNNFIKEFKKVSKHKELACATRFLCLWRPDYFVSFNGKNKNELCRELQISKSKINYDTYWDLIVEPFINSDWSKQIKPQKKTEAEIFSYRIALLDCIYCKFN